MKNVLPTLFATSATQINLLINTFVASFLIAGSVSWLYYADRLLEFPLGILGTGLATVMLQKLAQSHSIQDAENFSKTLDWGLRWVILLGFPATIGLVILAEPILSVLFQLAEFTANDVHASAQSLQGYSLGLVGFLGVKVLTPVFTIQSAHSVAVRYAWYSLAANLVFILLLVIPFAHGGIALATGLAAMLNAGFLLFFLLRKKIYLPLNGWISFGLRTIFASGIMFAALQYFLPISTWTLFELVKCMAIGGMSYSLSYFIILHFFRIIFIRKT
jgi:putative peptidoglycan lipid II flippase